MSRLYVTVTSDTGRREVTRRGRYTLDAKFSHMDIGGMEPCLVVAGDDQGFTVHVKDELGRWLLVHATGLTNKTDVQGEREKRCRKRRGHGVEGGS